MVEHLPEMNQVVGSVSGMERKKRQMGVWSEEGREGDRERGERKGRREEEKKEGRESERKESK